jgi:Right handed beta helix region
MRVRSLLTARTGTVRLPAGKIEISSELKLPAGAHDLTIIGDGTTLRASAKFTGRAILSCSGCRNITLRGFAIDGNRNTLEKPLPLAPTDVPFSRFYPDNGILIEDTDGLSIEHIDATDVTNFPILVSQSKNVLIAHVTIEHSGSRNAKGRNNTSGGILLEQGTQDFTVADSTFRDIRGNAVWTHSCYQSSRNQRGKIANNKFFNIGRDAIQVGHATQVQVVGNSGNRVGFNVEEVDVENAGTPVGIDTAGNVDQSIYESNHFEEVNGKCIDLDGFHDGTVRSNVCINRGKPEDYAYGNFGISLNNTSIEMRSRNIVIEDNQLEGMKFGGIFVIGSGHRIVRNRMRRMNTAHCNETHARFGCLAIAGEPGFLESGIYLARRAEKPDPVHGVTIENNVISGWKMKAHCIEAAPGVRLTDNVIRGNQCSDE